MTSVMLRRRKLGKTSCREVSGNMEDCVVVRNWMDDPWPEKVDYVFRWGCTSNLPRALNVVNKSEAIHRVSDKRGFRMILDAERLCPLTWGNKEDFYGDSIQGDYCYRPFIVRSATHAQGRGLWYFDSCINTDGEHDADELFRYLGEGNYYINEFIPKVAEYRVFVVSGRVAWVAKKTPGNPDAVAWNVNQGGRFDNVRWGDWPLAVCHAAIQAFHLTGLDFSGIDVMEDGDGKPYVLEANSAPSQTSPYRQECTAKAFQWIVDHGRDVIPLGAAGKYLPIIHPALTDKAIIGE